jgi:hypothetical protein
MKTFVFILLVLLLSGCISLKDSVIEYEYDAITAMNEQNDLVLISIRSLVDSYGTYDYYHWYFFYENKWHLGEDWFNSINYPFRTDKQNKKFIRKYNKKISNPPAPMLIKI